MERLDALEDRCAVVGDDDFALGRLDLRARVFRGDANDQLGVHAPFCPFLLGLETS